MEPSLLAGEYFTVRPMTRDRVAVLEPGSLVAHAFPPDPSKQFVKRIVGVPGDTLLMESGHLMRNSHLVSEPYAWHGDSTVDPVWDDFLWQARYLLPSVASSRYKASRDNWGPLLVPANVYFVLGDNRDNSLDSRYWGFLPFEDVRGMPARIYWSQDPETHAVRWSRIGHRPD
jgi:signal peptidase I